MTAWLTRVSKAGVIGVCLFVAYSVNGRDISSGDTIPTELVSVTLLRGDGFVLDRFAPLLAAMGEGGLPYFVVAHGNHVLSRYPVAPAILAAPLIFPQLRLIDAVRPDWERNVGLAASWTHIMAKNAAAAITALVGAALFLLLEGMGLGRSAALAVLITGLGSNLFATASQSLWQHGPAALALTAALAALAPPRVPRWRLCAGGLACAILFCCRQQDFIFPLVLGAWVLIRYRLAAIWFLPGPVVLATLLLWYNLTYFGSLIGGYAELIPMAVQSHGVDGMWSSEPWGGAAGTLLSPNRGLFVFTPWVALSLAALPATRARLAEWPGVRVAVITLAGFFAMLAFHSTWWAGWVYGPRYWTDVMPIFGVLLALALDWSRTNCRPWYAALVLAGVVAIGLQVIGVLCFPCSWMSTPSDINVDHARLWDCHDTEVGRCLQECPWGLDYQGTWRNTAAALLHQIR